MHIKHLLFVIRNVTLFQVFAFETKVFAFETRVSTATPPGIHIHSLELTLSEINQLKSGKFIHVETSVNSGHSHNLELRYLEKWNTSKYI